MPSLATTSFMQGWQNCPLFHKTSLLWFYFSQFVLASEKYIISFLHLSDCRLEYELEKQIDKMDLVRNLESSMLKNIFSFWSGWNFELTTALYSSFIAARLAKYLSKCKVHETGSVKSKANTISESGGGWPCDGDGCESSSKPWHPGHWGQHDPWSPRYWTGIFYSIVFLSNLSQFWVTYITTWDFWDICSNVLFLNPLLLQTS